MKTSQLSQFPLIQSSFIDKLRLVYADDDEDEESRSFSVVSV